MQVTGDNQNAHYALVKALSQGMPNIDETPFGTLPGAGTMSRLAGGLERAVRRDGPGMVRTSYRAPKTSFSNSTRRGPTSSTRGSSCSRNSARHSAAARF